MNEEFRMEKLNHRRNKGNDDKIARPYLLNRFIAGLIDLICVFICFALLEAFCYYVLYEPLGYQDAKDEILKMNEETHLYKYEDGSYVELNDNYEEAIIYYYSNDSKAIQDKKLEEYNANKINSTLDFSKESEATANFYKDQYSKAISYFKSNQDYIYLVNKTYLIVVYSLGLCLLISLTIFYLIIPLCRKEGETIGQIIFKICLIDSSDYSIVKKKQIVLRFLVLVTINYGLTAFIYFVFKYFTLLPALITLFMISFTKKNKGPHDYISSTHLILKHRADAMDTLKAINQY